MAVIQMPSRGKKDETGMITSWYKKTGDWVAQGDELFSFDTDEGTYTVKSQKAGRLVAIFVPEGELVHCPADVGMLASPAPDAVLRMGRMQFVDESKPLSPREAPQEAAPADPAPEVDAGTEAAEAPESAPDLPELPVAEEELLQAIPDETEEIPPVEEPSAQEEEEALEALTEAEELPAAAEEMAPAPQEEETPAAAEDPIAEEEPAVAEESVAEETPAAAEDPIAEEEPAAAEEPVAEEPAAAEEEPAEELPEPMPEELEAVPQADEAADEAEAEALPTTPRPACLTAQVDMTVCREIAARTGVKLGAMVRFAAMHTDSAALLDEIEDGTLRGMSGRALPNICDLSAYGITGATSTACGSPCFLVPAVHDAWRAKDGAVEVYPCLDLSLCFDENTVSMACAAGMLQQTRAHLTNLLDLLI